MQLPGYYRRVPRITLAALVWLTAANVAADEPSVDFNRDIRSILSDNCFKCHGPDAKKRQAGLRFDLRESALGERKSGKRAIIAGEPDHSELVRRITAADESDRMPPLDSGKSLSPGEIELLTEWIRQGAVYARHWSYTPPERPELPDTGKSTWPKNEIDRFILDRLRREGLFPTEEADRHALIRRLSLDLTGLPPTLEDVETFVGDSTPDALEKWVDRLLDKDTYGEHWARTWLDLARYADSAGYADDPPRTIWAYRDYVIRSLNANKPFDEFTIEQIAGDLLTDPTEEQLIATAFHRNTLTNNEGGTNDEEFRNVAIVDRVNTTMAVWMGTTIHCAQCHDHKFDPISQEEFFRLFAIFNNSEDADRRDERPLVQLWTDEQKKQKASWRQTIVELEKMLATATPELLAAQAEWESRFAAEPQWRTLRPGEVTLKSGAGATIADDGSVFIPKSQKTDVITFESALGDIETVTAFRLEALPHESLSGKGPGHAGGNFVITRVLASVTPGEGDRLRGRYVRVEISGKEKILSLAEVQVFSGADNIASGGKASQSSTAFDGPARLAIDGNTDGNYNAKSVTHTAIKENPWWELDLGAEVPVDRIVLWNRTDNNLQSRLKDYRIAVLGAERRPVWEKTVAKAPNPSSEFSLSGVRAVSLAAAYADHSQDGFDAARVLDTKNPNKAGWAIAPKLGEAHALTLIPASPVKASAGSTLTFTIEQLSSRQNHTLGHFRLSLTSDPGVSEFAKTPASIVSMLKRPANRRDDAEKAELTKYYVSIAPRLQAQREELKRVKKQLADIKAYATVPVMRERPDGRRRKTQIQRRGNFLDVGKEVSVGLPSAFHAAPEGEPINRLTLARWLVDEANPLTARVVVNRYWESIFGVGLVRTSEEFGSQGELPSHPELLDWLATELVAHDWDLKYLLKLLVTSAAYRQSSRVTPELIERDPDNRLLARGPRFRLSAEMIRDQALFVGGLLSPKLYGPPARPPRPASGLKAAFGGGIDWKPSEGEDRYRRGLYTTWRRSNPYPSMVAFDAPNREVCEIRRARTNTPLQALVTLNDPVYVEAAQALARRIAKKPIAKKPAETRDRARYGFRLCLARAPTDSELSRLVSLYERAHSLYGHDVESATLMATRPLGAVPEGSDVTELAAWTVVANVLLNLDEMFMKR